MTKGTLSLTLMALVTFTWLPAALPADDANDYYKFSSWFQGTWQGEGEENGGKTIIRGKCAASFGRCNTYASEGKTSLWGYDPKQKAWSGVGYMADGSRFLRSCNKPNVAAMKAGVTLSGTGTLWHADGTVHFETITITCIDDKTARFVTQRKDQDGKNLPTLIMISRRIK